MSITPSLHIYIYIYISYIYIYTLQCSMLYYIISYRITLYYMLFVVFVIDCLFWCVVFVRSVLRPVRLLRVLVSEGLTQADP